MKNHSNSSVVRSMFDPSEVTMISLAVEAPFLVLTTLTVLYVVFLDLMKHKKFFHSDTLENSMFWLYALYIIAILVTVLRIPIRLLPGTPVPPEFITIIYNWATTLMIAVSAFLPWRLYRSAKKVQRLNLKAMKPMIAIVLVWVILLMTTVVVLIVSWSALSMLLFVWRVFFMVCASAEIILLILVVGVLGSKQFQKLKTLRWYVYTTSVMRSSIVITIILKHIGAMDVFFLKTIHMFIIIAGLLAYASAIREREVVKDRRASEMEESRRMSRLRGSAGPRRGDDSTNDDSATSNISSGSGSNVEVVGSDSSPSASKYAVQVQAGVDPPANS